MYTKFPQNSRSWAEASPGYFSGGGTPRPLKVYHKPPAGGPGAAAPRKLAKFHFVKRFKVLDKESIFQI